MTKDLELQFPHYVILKASAGSGKTTELTERFIHFLLSDKIPNNSLKNILAITFSNNASYEMKSRIIELLKSLYFQDEDALKRISKNLSLSHDEISTKSGKILDEIFDNYSDFQVKTIDSFMTSIFKASAVDFDYNPDFEILMNNQSLMRYSYDVYLKDIGEDTVKTEFFREIIKIISQNKKTYLWNPADAIFNEIRGLHSQIYNTNKDFIVVDEYIKIKNDIEVKLIDIMQSLKREIEQSGLEITRATKILDDFEIVIENKNFRQLLDRPIKKPPFNKPKNSALLKKYEEVLQNWSNFIDILRKYAYYYALIFYMPYLKVYRNFEDLLKQIKQREFKIFIEDINKMLSQYLNSLVVPDIYFRLGEKIHHFFIDEYQDTSPLQWNNIRFLIENALAENGSLFVVGDTKQAIYNFRGADYKIMRRLEKDNVFPSAIKIVKTLDKNYRSKKVIIDFIVEIFKDKISRDPIYSEPATYTGLHECEQIPKDKSKEGYVEIRRFSEEEDEEDNIKRYIGEIINDVTNRGYLFKDIAILAFKNQQVVNITEWLNDLQLPFISYSSLDVRKRKVTSEILSLLEFLDSPINDFCFSRFLVGDIFKNLIKHQKIACYPEEFLLKYRDNTPLYKFFERDFPDLWDKYFKALFRFSGYLPIYDLLSIALSNFKVFETMPDEEAVFLKLLELVKDFEERGYSNIKALIDFFESNGDDETIWNINLGTDINAIQVMTIHKAKGLGFPVVLVYLKHEHIPKNRYILCELNNGIHILKITDKIAEKNQTLLTIKQDSKKSELAEMLNTLYVALTRAEDELYILCRTDNQDKFPFDILAERFDSSIGKKSFKDKSKILPKSSQIKPRHYPVLFDFSVSNDMIHFGEKKRGDFIHKILEHIEYVNEEVLEKLDSLIENLNREFHSNFPIFETKSLIIDMINHRDIRDLFSPIHERVYNEFEIIDKDGFTYRVDRVIENKDYVAVIDYKTGYPQHKHFLQVKLYMSILSEIFKDKTIKGYLYYLDLKEVRKIE